MAGERWVRVYAAVAAGVAAATTAASLALFSPTTDGWLHAARYTARWSFIVFLVAFLGPVLMRGFDETRTRAAILAFGAAHGIHLAVLVTYRVVVGETPPVTALVVGGLAYGLIVALMVAELVRRSGPVFRAVTLHYALLVFVLTYASRLNAPETKWVGIIGVGVGIAAFLLRTGITTRNYFSSSRSR